MSDMTADAARDPFGPDALDFWLGEWDLSWEGGQGANRLTRVVGGQGILEDFEGRDQDGTMRGMSLSIRERETGRWRQTWIDSHGSYLDLAGVEVDGRIAFLRTLVVDGKPIQQRMIWSHVSADALRWVWQRSVDGGETWMAVWSIDYRRRATR